MEFVFAVKCCADIRTCAMTDRDGFVLGTYPYVWLCDDCHCEQCFHPSLYPRLLLMTNLDLDITPIDAEIKKSDQTLTVQWSDKHHSNYSISWLLENHFPNTIEDPISKPKRHLWGSEMQQKIPSFAFNGILKSDKFLHDWIEHCRSMIWPWSKTRHNKRVLYWKLAKELGSWKLQITGE